MIKTSTQTNLAKNEKTWNEWWFVVGVVVFVLAITSVPFVYASATAPADKQYMGIMLDVPDHLQYFSWMRELSSANLAANKLTPEPNGAVFFNLLWWMLGRIDGWLGIGFPGALQVLRVVSTLLFLPLVYYLCTVFLSQRQTRITAFLLITLSAGFGWVLILMKYTVTPGVVLYPLDVFVAEGNTFLSILGYPHFIGAALYVAVFGLLLAGQKKNQLRYSVAAGLFAQFLGWQHAYDLISVYSVIGAYALLLLLRDRRLPAYVIKAGLIIGVLSVWPALYSVMLTTLDPLWQRVLDQFSNAGVFTPGPLHLVVLFGLTFLFALAQLIREKFWRLRGASDLDLFLWGWFLVTFVTIYLPVDYQIHMLNGWQVPMGILAARFLIDVVTPRIGLLLQKIMPAVSSESARKISLISIILFASLTNIYHLGQRFLDLNRHTYPYYLHKDEIAAFNWLEQNVDSSDVVISSLTVGQYIPAETGSHAFLAHWAQTVDFYEKERQVAKFYQNMTGTEERATVLRQYGVDYVFWGPAEQSLGDFRPDLDKGLTEVFSSPLVRLYRVK